MDPDPLNALRFCLLQHGQQMGNMAVHVSVAQKADKVKRSPGIFDAGNQVFPGIRGIDPSVLDGLVHQSGTLGIDLPAAQRIVTHLTVAHVLIRGHPDRRPVRPEGPVRVVCLQHIQGWRRGLHHHVAKFIG